MSRDPAPADAEPAIPRRLRGLWDAADAGAAAMFVKGTPCCLRNKTRNSKTGPLAPGDGGGGSPLYNTESSLDSAGGAPFYNAETSLKLLLQDSCSGACL